MSTVVYTVFKMSSLNEIEVQGYEATNISEDGLLTVVDNGTTDKPSVSDVPDKPIFIPADHMVNWPYISREEATILTNHEGWRKWDS